MALVGETVKQLFFIICSAFEVVLDRRVGLQQTSQLFLEVESQEFSFDI